MMPFYTSEDVLRSVAKQDDVLEDEFEISDEAETEEEEEEEELPGEE